MTVESLCIRYFLVSNRSASGRSDNDDVVQGTRVLNVGYRVNLMLQNSPSKESDDSHQLSSILAEKEERKNGIH